MPAQTSPSPQRRTLTRLFKAGMNAVQGHEAVKRFAVQNPRKAFDAAIAVGKAASLMLKGAESLLKPRAPALIVTKYGHARPPHPADARLIEAGHPIPNADSLRAGQAVLDFIRDRRPDDRVLALLSGGASALVEILEPPHTLDDLVALTRNALADGSDIHAFNRRRRALSAIKNGKLSAHFRGRHFEILAISDVRGDDIRTIGSGLFAPPPDGAADFNATLHIVASNVKARCAVAEAAQRLGIPVRRQEENLYGDVNDTARALFDICAHDEPGLFIFGGEPTVLLPPDPGRGGRNQALALRFAEHIQGRSDIAALIAGTDGCDGDADAAGAFVDGHSFRRRPGAERALNAADSAPFFAASGDRFAIAPGETNVMDLALLLKEP